MSGSTGPQHDIVLPDFAISSTSMTTGPERCQLLTIIWFGLDKQMGRLFGCQLGQYQRQAAQNNIGNQGSGSRSEVKWNAVARRSALTRAYLSIERSSDRLDTLGKYPTTTYMAASHDRSPFHGTLLSSLPSQLRISQFKVWPYWSRLIFATRLASGMMIKLSRGSKMAKPLIARWMGNPPLYQ
jgi:hypothetical protein